MAGLPQSNAWVKVGPPLSCSGPSFSTAAVMLNRSLGPGAIETLVEPIRLNPPDWIAADASLKRSTIAVFAAMMLFLSSTTPSLELRIPPPPCEEPPGTTLALMVLLVSDTVPRSLKMPPPPDEPVPPVPAPPPATLPLTVLFSMVTVPKAFAIPPP